MFSQSFKENLREYVALRQHSQSFLTENNIMKFSSQRVVTDLTQLNSLLFILLNLLSFNRIPYTKYCVQRKQKRSQCVHSVYNLKILKKNSYFRYNKKNRFKRPVTSSFQSQYQSSNPIRETQLSNKHRGSKFVTTNKKMTNV